MCYGSVTTGNNVAAAAPIAELDLDTLEED